MQIIAGSTQHYHTFLGVGGGMPLYDLAYDTASEATEMFFKITGSLYNNQINKVEQENARYQLQDKLETDPDYGLVVDAGPFRIMVTNCEGCRALNNN